MYLNVPSVRTMSVHYVSKTVAMPLIENILNFIVQSIDDNDL